MGGFSVDCGFNGFRSGLVRVSREGVHLLLEFYVEFDVWIN